MGMKVSGAHTGSPVLIFTVITMIMSASDCSADPLHRMAKLDVSCYLDYMSATEYFQSTVKSLNEAKEVASQTANDVADPNTKEALQTLADALATYKDMFANVPTLFHHTNIHVLSCGEVRYMFFSKTVTDFIQYSNNMAEQLTEVSSTINAEIINQNERKALSDALLKIVHYFKLIEEFLQNLHDDIQFLKEDFVNKKNMEDGFDLCRTNRSEWHITSTADDIQEKAMEVKDSYAEMAAGLTNLISKLD